MAKSKRGFEAWLARRGLKPVRLVETPGKAVLIVEDGPPTGRRGQKQRSK